MNLLLIIIIILGILSIIYIINYNNLQFIKTKIESAENIINENLRKKYDLLINIIDIIDNELKNKKKYFKDYLNLKDKKVTNFDFDRKLVEIENIISKLLLDNNIDNGELKIKMVELKECNEVLESAKSYYNINTTTLNNYIRSFPSLIVARIHHFKIKFFYDGINNQDDITNDFKL